MKWRKYMLLRDFDLLPAGEMKNIHRFPAAARERVRRFLEMSLREAKGQRLFVVKLVPPNAPGQLPNLRITSRRDLSRLGDFFHQWESYPFIEIWCCQTTIDRSVLSVAGRIVISNLDIRSHSVEQLWRASPRMLEYYHLGEHFQHSYLRASRVAWGWPYAIESVRLANSGKSFPRSTRSSLLQDFSVTMLKLEEKRDLLETFTAFLNKRGAPVASIEYKLVDSVFSIIDWDTSDDKRVLRNLCV